MLTSLFVLGGCRFRATSTNPPGEAVTLERNLSLGIEPFCIAVGQALGQVSGPVAAAVYAALAAGAFGLLSYSGCLVRAAGKFGSGAKTLWRGVFKHLRLFRAR